MIPQGLLPFKLEHTEEKITPRGGLALFAEVVRALKVREKIRGAFPRPGSNRGYEAWAYIEPVLLMLVGGGRHIEDLREIRDDPALRTLIGLRAMPSLSTFGDWLVRRGATGGVRTMRRVDEEIAGAILKRTATADYTLDVDATVIEAEKKEAKPTYKGFPGYQPQLGFLAENGICLTQEFRHGNVPAQSGAVRFLKRSLGLCPKIKRLRSDSAFYQAKVLNWCEKNGIGFTITADQDVAVQGVIRTVRDWEPLRDGDLKPTDREVGTAIHVMNQAKTPFRLVVQRWRDRQLSLFEPNGYRYYIVATNRDDLTPSEVVRFHNERGQAENLIKELKIGFGMEQMTSGHFKANALWFAIGVLAYNLVQAQKLLFLDTDWKTKTIASLRWQLLETAGRLVRHGRQWVLRLATSWEKYVLFVRVRQRLRAFV
jgi:Transposase DDE domain group 1